MRKPYVPGGLGAGLGANDSINLRPGMTTTITVYGDVRSFAGTGLPAAGRVEV